MSLLPAVAGAAFSAASATLSSLSGARRAALRDILSGPPRRALERYLAAEATIETRWLLLRVVGVAVTAALVTGSCLASAVSWPAAVSLGVAASALAYAIPSEIAREVLVSRAEQAAPTLLRLLRPFEWLAVPVADPIAKTAKVLGGSGRKIRRPTASITESEVEMIVNEGELNGSLAHDQSEMIRNVLDFGDVSAGEVMVPRTHVDALDERTPIDEVLRTVGETQHSRYPVFSERIDNVVGILHVKDLFTAVARNRHRSTTLRTLMRGPVAFVPESQTASTVLKDMRAGRHHMAVVIDEFGGFSGVVTLEDLLEEIVGDIRDEHDLEDDADIVELGDGKLLVDASIPISDLNRRLGTQLPDDGDYISLGGLLVDQLGKVPDPGAHHEAHGLRFVVRDADERHISQVEIQPLPPSPESVPSGSRGSDAASAA